MFYGQTGLVDIQDLCQMKKNAACTVSQNGQTFFNNKQIQFVASCLIVGIFSISLLGCGSKSSGPATYKISGTVNLDGSPLESGSILFVDPDRQVQTYFATVRDGSFQTVIEAGKRDVQITSVRESKDKKVPSADGSGMVPASEQIIPVKYNEKTELQIAVEPGAKNQFEFELKSK